MKQHLSTCVGEGAHFGGHSLAYSSSFQCHFPNTAANPPPSCSYNFIKSTRSDGGGGDCAIAVWSYGAPMCHHFRERIRSWKNGWSHISKLHWQFAFTNMHENRCLWGEKTRGKNLHVEISFIRDGPFVVVFKIKLYRILKNKTYNPCTNRSAFGTCNKLIRPKSLCLCFPKVL